MKRLFDFLFAFFLLILLFPFFLIISILVKLTSDGPVFYRQVRVGLNGIEFCIYKFRTMHSGAEKLGLLTVGGRDRRITPAGYMLRKYKLDELPQLINILKGEMSFVGPRPEVKRYVEMYTAEQRKVLSVRPGLTDYASIKYAAESSLLANSPDPEKEYIHHIMPDKLNMNLKYIQERNFFSDIKILVLTIRRVMTSG